MPWSLPIDHPVPLQIATVHGLYGTVRVAHEGHIVEGPVVFGALRVLPDYQGLVDRSLADVLPPGTTVLAQMSALGEGGLPIIDVMVGPKETLAETWIRSGWAVPDEATYADGLHRTQYVTALTAARTAHAGIWAEQGVTAREVGLSAALDHRTQPAVTPAHLGMIALLCVFGVAIVAGWRERVWRERLRAAAPPAETRTGLLGRAGRTARSVTRAWFGVAPGLFKGVPVPPLSSAGAHAGAGRSEGQAAGEPS